MAHTCRVVSGPSPAILGGSQDGLNRCFGQSLFGFMNLRSIRNLIFAVREGKTGHTGMACMVGRPGLVGATILLAQNFEGIIRMTCEYFTFDLRCDQVGCPLLQEPGMDYQTLLLPPLVTGLGHM